TGRLWNSSARLSAMKKSRHQNFERHDPRYQGLLEVSEAIASHRNITDLLQDLAHRLPSIMRLNFIGLALHRPEHNTIQDFIIQGNIPADIQGGKEWPVEAHPGGWVWQLQQPLVFPDLT